jgi:hypothetical protein
LVTKKGERFIARVRAWPEIVVEGDTDPPAFWRRHRSLFSHDHDLLAFNRSLLDNSITVLTLADMKLCLAPLRGWLSGIYQLLVAAPLLPTTPVE